MSSNKQLVNHFNEFSTLTWLVFIKVLENKTDEELKQLENDDIQLYMLQNANWYVILIDLALRLSDYSNTKVCFSKLPTKYDYRKFLSLYINCSDDTSNFTSSLDHSVGVALSQYGYEQFKRYTPPVNDLGRLIKLYESKEALFKEFFGLSPKQILYFYILNNGKHDIYEPFDFSNMFRLLSEYDNKITKKKLSKFLETFSITIKAYRDKAKELGITKKTMKSKRLIENFPIIFFENDMYFIPSINILLESLTYKVFENLKNLQTNEHNFKRNFGDPFENYVRELAKFSHNDCFYECDELVHNNEEKKKAEFYLLKNDSTLIVEAKVLDIDDNTIINASSKDLENELKDTIHVALKQISSCFEHLKAKNKYGIIIIHTHIPLLENYIELFKEKTKYDFLDNIIIMSIIDYEIMIHNSFENIIDYFEQPKDDINKTQIALFFEQRNTCLEHCVLEVIDELKSNFQKGEKFRVR